MSDTDNVWCTVSSSTYILGKTNPPCSAVLCAIAQLLVCSLFLRLTDLAERKLTTIYGEEDSATLQNVLHNVPNIVPRLLNLTSSANDNNNIVESGIVMPVVDHSALQSISEDCMQHGSNSVAAVVSVHADKDGAYVNPIITENSNPDSPDNAGVAGNSESTTSRIGKQLVRQDCTVSEEDDQSVKNLGDDGMNRDKASLAESPQNGLLSSSQEEALNNSTLHTFLRMVSTQSIDVNERLESTDAPSQGQSQTQVIYFTFLFQKLYSP